MYYDFSWPKKEMKNIFSCLASSKFSPGKKLFFTLFSCTQNQNQFKTYYMYILLKIAYFNIFA